MAWPLGLMAQNIGERVEGPPPGNMQILPGYEHHRLQGIDSSVGEIVKEDRVVIRYDIGPLAGLWIQPENKEKCQRYEEKRVHDQTARYCYNPYSLTVTFVQSSANFSAIPEDEAELVNVLSMLETYRTSLILEPKE